MEDAADGSSAILVNLLKMFTSGSPGTVTINGVPTPIHGMVDELFLFPDWSYKTLPVLRMFVVTNKKKKTRTVRIKEFSEGLEDADLVTDLATCIRKGVQLMKITIPATSSEGVTAVLFFDTERHALCTRDVPVPRMEQYRADNAGRLALSVWFVNPEFDMDYITVPSYLTVFLPRHATLSHIAHHLQEQHVVDTYIQPLFPHKVRYDFKYVTVVDGEDTILHLQDLGACVWDVAFDPVRFRYVLGVYVQ